MQKLMAWKDKEDRKPLLLTGVRQCGKTYVCKAFGETYFSDYAYFNFEGNSGLASVFEYDFNFGLVRTSLSLPVYLFCVCHSSTLASMYLNTLACWLAIS